MNKTIVRFSPKNTTTMTSSSNIRIRNFRPASGFIIALDDDETDDDKSAIVSSSSAARLQASSTVYRCGSTDVLGRELNISGSSSLSSSFTTTDEDQIVFQHAGLIIDLRSPAERNEKDAQRWMNDSSSVVASSVVASSSTVSPVATQQRRPIHVFTIPIDDKDDDKESSSSSVIGELHEQIFDDDDRRYVIRLDILNRIELLRYIQNNWLSSLKDSSASSLTEEFNKRGLAGLNEAILETKSGQIGLCRALQIMTIYREAIIMTKKKKKKNNNTNIQTNDDDDTSIVIHCVQGKDRTGMLVMLMQLLMGNTIISDNEIIEDYHRSNNNNAVNIKSKYRRRNEGSATASSAAAAAIIVGGGGENDNDNHKSSRIIKMDKRVFSGTNREAMISTLEGLRRRYGYNNNDDDEREGGSTSPRFGSFDRTIPRYFDLIGFNDSWRKRFRSVFIKKKNNNTGNNIRRSRL